MRLDLKVVLSQVHSKVFLQVLAHLLVCSSWMGSQETFAQAAP
jgi:hypothetical protein